MKDPIKSLFVVEWWLREITLRKPDRTENMVFTRQEMMDFAREEIEKDRQYNCVFYWVRYDRDIPRPNYPDYAPPDSGTVGRDNKIARSFGDE